VGRATQRDVTKIETKQLTKCLVMHQLSQFPHLLGQNLLLKVQCVKIEYLLTEMQYDIHDYVFSGV